MKPAHPEVVMNAAVAELRAQRAQIAEAADSAFKWIWINVAIAVAGAGISMAGFLDAAHSETGGTYRIFWGAVVFGGWGAIRQTIRHYKCISILREFDGALTSSVQQPGATAPPDAPAPSGPAAPVIDRKQPRAMRVGDLQLVPNSRGAFDLLDQYGDATECDGAWPVKTGDEACVVFVDGDSLTVASGTARQWVPWRRLRTLTETGEAGVSIGIDDQPERTLTFRSSRQRREFIAKVAGHVPAAPTVSPAVAASVTDVATSPATSNEVVADPGAPAAGWYLAPDGSGEQWWTGTAWGPRRS